MSAPSPIDGGKPVTIIGAGFSGLVTAFYLVRAGFRVQIHERAERAGGLIATKKESFGLVETAANGLLNSAYVEDLFSTIDLPLEPTLKEARRRYIFRDGEPRRWPLSFGGTVSVIWFVLRSIFFKALVRPRDGETVSNWADRVLGEEASRYLVSAALQGIYAGDPSRMSASLIFGRFFQPKKMASKPNVRGTVTAPEGMGQLIEKLKTYLEKTGVEFHLQSEIESVSEKPSHPLVIATSASQAAVLLKEFDPVRADACASVELLPIVAVTVSTARPPKTQGFGCLFPPVEKRRALGVLMNNFIFANRATRGFCENWIFGGALNQVPDLLKRSDQEIVKLVKEERDAAFATNSEILDASITRWPAALPHYTTELEKALPKIKGLRQNVLLIGNYVGTIGLAKILESAATVPDEISEKGEWS